MKIAIPGGSGQVGHILARHFNRAGHDVIVLARRPQPAPWRTVQWDGRTLSDWTQHIDGADLVINLAGRSVNCRYTAANRREITESRTETTRLIGKVIARSSHPPRIWMNASTATIYRHTLDRAMDEASGDIGGNEPNTPSTWRFSTDVATSWEQAFLDSRAPATRKIAAP